MILSKRRCALFALMGAGKTVITLTAIQRLIDEFEVRKVLVVSTKRVARLVWPAEVHDWEHLRHLRVENLRGPEPQRIRALGRKADIYTISMDSLQWLVDHYGDAWPFDMVVLDESRSFSGHDGKRFKAAKKIRRKARYFVELTGTPTPQGLTDLWAQLYLLDGGERLGVNITAFRERWFTYNPWEYRYKPKKHAQSEITQLISDICMVVESYDGLPEGTKNIIKCPLSDADMKRYKDFEEERVLEMVGVDLTPVNAAVLTNKLLQYANGAVYDDNRVAHTVHDEKLDALADLLDRLNGDPLLLAYSFEHDIQRIKERFPYAVELTDNPKIVKDWNAGKIPLLLAHPKSAGHGLNLQFGGANICWFGLSWSLELHDQLNARLLRSGQTRSVFIHYLVVPDSMDEIVLRSLDNKSEAQASLLSELRALVAARLNSQLTASAP